MGARGSTMRRPLALQATRHGGQKYEAQFKLCLECIEFSSFYLHQDGAVLLDVKKGACYSMNVVAAPRLDSDGKEARKGITLGT